MTPRSLETFLRPASLPGVSFMRILLGVRIDECCGTCNCKPGGKKNCVGRRVLRVAGSRHRAASLFGNSHASVLRTARWLLCLYTLQHARGKIVDSPEEASDSP